MWLFGMACGAKGDCIRMNCTCSCVGPDCNAGIEECPECKLLKAIGREVLRRKKEYEEMGTSNRIDMTDWQHAQEVCLDEVIEEAKKNG